MAQQKFTVSVPDGYESEERRAIGEEIIQQIIERSKSGKDKNGIDFPKYSKSYMDSFDFKLAGKGKKPNLTLSGEMLNALTVLDTGSGEITIGYREADKFNNDKAEGNIKGSYGGEPQASKARDFLGVSDSELSSILTKYPVPEDRSLGLGDLGSLLIAMRESEDLADQFFGMGNNSEL